MQNKGSGKKLLIGVTGGIGSGKTLACKFFEKAGFTVFYADDIAKKLYRTDKTLKEKLVKEFGNDILVKGALSVNKLRDLVFGNVKNDKRVNKIVHPFVIAKILILAGKSASNIVMIEAALIFESGFDKFLDYIINISAPQKIRIKRVRKRTSFSDKVIRSIMTMQLSEKERNNKSDFVIKNEGRMEDFKNKLQFIEKIILNLA